MSILDKSAEIIENIKDTPEYRNYLKYKNLLEQDEELKNKYLYFRYTLTDIYLNNKDGDNIEISDHLYLVYETLTNNPISKEFMFYEDMLFHFYDKIKEMFVNEIEILK